MLLFKESEKKIPSSSPSSSSSLRLLVIFDFLCFEMPFRSFHSCFFLFGYLLTSEFQCGICKKRKPNGYTFIWFIHMKLISDSKKTKLNDNILHSSQKLCLTLLDFVSNNCMFRVCFLCITIKVSSALNGNDAENLCIFQKNQLCSNKYSFSLLRSRLLWGSLDEVVLNENVTHLRSKCQIIDFRH